MHGATGYASEVVLQSEKKRDVGGGCVGEEGQIDEFLFQRRCLVQGMLLEQLPLAH